MLVLKKGCFFPFCLHATICLRDCLTILSRSTRASASHNSQFTRNRGVSLAMTLCSTWMSDPSSHLDESFTLRQFSHSPSSSSFIFTSTAELECVHTGSRMPPVLHERSASPSHFTRRPNPPTSCTSKILVSCPRNVPCCARSCAVLQTDHPMPFARGTNAHAPRPRARRTSRPACRDAGQ